VESQPIIVNACRVRQLQITAQEDDLGLGQGAQVGLGDEDDMPGVLELLVEQVRLGDTCLEVPLHGGLLEILPREVVVIDLGAIRVPGTAAGLGAGGGEGERRIAPQRGKEMAAALSRPRRLSEN
jgi:hypothetical protein